MLAKWLQPLALALSVLPFNASALDASNGITVKNILKTTSSWDGQPLAYPQGQAQISGMLIEIAPGAETGWHLHPVPSFGLVLEGDLEVTLKDGRHRQFHTSDALAEVVNTLHNGRNIGKKPLKLLVFYAGVVDQPTAIKETPQQDPPMMK